MYNKILLLFSIFIFPILVRSQEESTSLSGQNRVTSGVPFLTITPDSRGSSMGETGVATRPDINSQNWNIAKYAFIEKNMGISISFIPWLRNIAKDINLGYLVGYYKIDKVSAISTSFRLFTLGSIEYSDIYGTFTGKGNPTEFAVDAAYSRALSNHISVGTALRYIRSDISNGNETRDIGKAYAGDIGFYYKKSDILFQGINTDLALGASIINLGSKINYDSDRKEFIPTKLKLGASWGLKLNKLNTLNFSLDINKLLVPIESDSIDTPFGGIAQSFSDAPNGIKGELEEIQISSGVEFWYTEQLAIRAGYFHENAYHGNRKFITAGFGLMFETFGLDLSYIAPVIGNSPLANTIRFSLLYNVDI